MSPWFRGALVMATILVVAMVLRALLPTRTEAFVGYAFQQELLSNELNDVIGHVTQIALAGTRFEGRWSINRPLDPDGISIYVVRCPKDLRLPARFSRYRGNLSYVGDVRAIVLDVDKFRQIAQDIGLVSPQGNDENPFAYARKREREVADADRVLAHWVMGHELGHIVERHRASHFSPDATDKFPVYGRSGLQREYEADRFFAAQLSRALALGEMSSEEISGMSDQLIRVLEYGYLERVGPQAKPAFGPLAFLSGPQLAEPPVSSHPEFFLRAGRLLALLDHPLQELFAAQIPKFEQRVMSPAVVPGLLVVEGDPAAQVEFATDAVRPRRAPFKLWLPPGNYRFKISEDGYVSQSAAVSVAPDSRRQVNYHLTADREKPRSATQETADRLSAAMNSISAATSHEWVDPIPNAAAWDLDRAARLMPEWSRPWFLRAEQAIRAGQCEAAFADFERGVALLRKEPYWLRNAMTYQLHQLGDLERGFVAAPDDPSATWAYLEALWVLRRTDEAAAILRNLPPRFASDASVRLLAALLRWDQGHAADALVLLTTLVDDIEAHDASVEDWTPRQWRAHLYEQLGNRRAAQADYRVLIAEAADDVVRQAELYAMSGDPRRAMVLLNAQAPDWHSETCGLAELQRRAGERDEEILLVQDSDRRPECRLLKGLELIDRHDYSRAAITCSDNDGMMNRDLMLCRAHALAALGDRVASVEALRRALWMDPENVAIRREIAHLETQSGLDAVAKCDRAVAERLAPK